MRTIAITGGIGSGKTAVTDYLEEKGFPVIDTDRMAHAMTAPGGKAIPYIRAHFGTEYILPDGSMDRDAVRNVVYRNPEMMKVLEKGTTEVIVRDTEAEIERMRVQGAPVTFVAIPLLFETGSDGSEYDGVWAVTASEEVRLQRVMARDGLTEEMVRRILKKQVSDDVRREMATEIIDNSGTLAELREKVDLLLQKNHFIS